MDFTFEIAITVIQSKLKRKDFSPSAQNVDYFSKMLVQYINRLHPVSSLPRNYVNENGKMTTPSL
jgi:hypothetical protein